MKLNELRYPKDIVLGVKNQQAFQISSQKSSCDGMESKERLQNILPGTKKKRGSEDQTTELMGSKGPTHFKIVSDLSRSAYCVDYDRLGLGSINIPSKNKGNPWRLTTINLPYLVCSRYIIIVIVAGGGALTLQATSGHVQVHVNRVLFKLIYDHFSGLFTAHFNLFLIAAIHQYGLFQIS